MNDSNNVCQCQILLTAWGTKLKLGKLTCLLGIRELWFFCCKLAGHVINFRKFNKEISSCEDYHFTLQSASEFPVILQAVQKSPLLQSNCEYSRVFSPHQGKYGVFSAPYSVPSKLPRSKNLPSPCKTSKGVKYVLLKCFNCLKFYHLHCSAAWKSHKEYLKHYL